MFLEGLKVLLALNGGAAIALMTLVGHADKKRREAPAVQRTFAL